MRNSKTFQPKHSPLSLPHAGEGGYYDQPKRVGWYFRWHGVILALVIAFLLQGVFWFVGGIDAAGRVQAATLHNTQIVDSEDFALRYGFLTSRPVGTVGSWIISDTTYMATGATLVEGAPVVGDCVEMKTHDNAPTVAVKIVKQATEKCENDEEEVDGSNTTLYRYGVVSSRPEGVEGIWVVKNSAYTADANTVVEGDIVVGDCVEVEVAGNAKSTALKILEKSASECIGSGNAQDRTEWEGTIDSFPALLLGTWVITVGESEKLTFTTSLATRYAPALPTSFAVGRWVEVKGSRQVDGSFLAERVRVDDYEVGEIVVRLESAAFSNTIASKFGLVVTSTLLSQANIFLFATTNENEQSLVQQISREEGVVWAEVNYVNGVPEEDGYKTWGWGGPDEPDAYTGQDAYQQIRWENARRYYDGAGIVVAVLDTGIYTPHEQFVGKLKLPSLDVIDDDTDPSEEGPGLAWGHGTHIAGVIAAMAPEADILPVRVLDQNGRGNSFLLAYAIEWVSQQPGVQVINLSLGTEYNSKILRDVIKGVVDQGILVIAAAGNDGTDRVQYPAGYDGVISVTAVDANLQKATFANYGKDWIDLSAPGVGIMSTMINSEGAGYATWSGTSMSTAFVSGAAALLVEKGDAQQAASGGLLDQLLSTGLVVDALNPLFAGQIGRLLDVSAALEIPMMSLFMPQAQK